MGLTASIAATAASRLAVLASSPAEASVLSLMTISVGPSTPPMVLSAAELLSEETAVEVLSAEEPQAASSIAQQRITGISFFMGLVLL